jgi:hypothetical protein
MTTCAAPSQRGVRRLPRSTNRDGAVAPGFVENEQRAILLARSQGSARVLALSARPEGLYRYSASRKTETV